MSVPQITTLLDEALIGIVSVGGMRATALG